MEIYILSRIFSPLYNYHHHSGSYEQRKSACEKHRIIPCIRFVHVLYIVRSVCISYVIAIDCSDVTFYRILGNNVFNQFTISIFWKVFELPSPLRFGIYNLLADFFTVSHQIYCYTIRSNAILVFCIIPHLGTTHIDSLKFVCDRSVSNDSGFRYICAVCNE